jgi:O6-methylguanine-DNA--protein-cysteine methyltransferase
VSAVGERVMWHFAEARTDTGLMRAAVWLEQMTALAYEEAGAALGGGDRRLAEAFAAHEHAHAAALESVLEGFTVYVRSRPELVDVDFHVPALRGGSRDAVLAALAELEAGLVAGYQRVARRATEPELLPTVAAVIAGGAQHLVALRRALGRGLVPHAFERGA